MPRKDRYSEIPMQHQQCTDCLVPRKDCCLLNTCNRYAEQAKGDALWTRMTSATAKKQRVKGAVSRLRGSWATDGFMYIKEARQELLSFLTCMVLHSSADR